MLSKTDRMIPKHFVRLVLELRYFLIIKVDLKFLTLFFSRLKKEIVENLIRNF